MASYVFGHRFDAGRRPGNVNTPFERNYWCYSGSSVDKPQLENGDKVILPPSALRHLASSNIQFPMLFELQNPATNYTMRCGVLEFVANENTVYLPYWIMENLLLEDGDFVKIKSVTLPKATYVRLQPHNKEFLNIPDAKSVLKNILKNFSCLTVGHSILAAHNNKEYYLDVVEAKPAGAISISDADFEVDLVPTSDDKKDEAPKLRSLPSGRKSLPLTPQQTSVAAPVSLPPPPLQTSSALLTNNSLTALPDKVPAEPTRTTSQDKSPLDKAPPRVTPVQKETMPALKEKAPVENVSRDKVADIVSGRLQSPSIPPMPSTSGPRPESASSAPLSEKMSSVTDIKGTSLQNNLPASAPISKEALDSSLPKDSSSPSPTQNGSGASKAENSAPEDAKGDKEPSDSKFKPFTGAARRLDGKTVKISDADEKIPSPPILSDSQNEKKPQDPTPGSAGLLNRFGRIMSTVSRGRK